MNPFFARIQQLAQETPDSIAISHRLRGTEYRETTWAQLLKLATGFSHLEPTQEIVPMLFGKSAECIAAMIGVAQSGRTFSVLNTKLRTPHVVPILERIDAKVAMIDGDGLMMLKSGLEDEPRLAETKWILINGHQLKKPQQKVLDRLQAVAEVVEWNFDDVDCETPAAAAVETATTDNDIMCCVFTSGSTGKPKGVLIDTSDLLARVEIEVEHFSMADHDVILSILPFSFDIGTCTVLSCIIAGCELSILESWLPNDILSSIEHRKVTGIPATPPLWQDFINHGQRFDRSNGEGPHASLRFLTLSGADLLPEQLKKLTEIVDGAGLFKTYGQTEAYRAMSLRPWQFEEHLTSVGTLFKGSYIHIVDPDGNVLPQGETGEIVHTGVGVMAGYLDKDGEDVKLRPNTFDDQSKNCIFTGDEGYLDDHGYLYLAGRRDAMIKVNGNRVYPQEVGDIMLGIDGILSAEVFGVKDEQNKSHLAAFIVMDPEFEFDESKILLTLGQMAPSYMVPGRVILKSEYPKTLTGKIDRVTLTAEAKSLFCEEAVPALV